MMQFSNNRLPCPKCGARRGFAPYLDSEGGYCHACTSTMKDNRDYRSEYKPVTKTLSVEPIDVYCQLKDFEESIFCKYFGNLFGDGFIWWCKNYFGLMSDYAGATVFPYYNYKGNFINLKSIPYKLDGHRDKTGFVFNFQSGPVNFPALFGARINPENTIFMSKKQGFKQCLFNEFHLNPAHQSSFLYELGYLNDKSNIIILLESEKSVVIAQYFYPKYQFLATGGLSGLTKDKAQILKGRRVGVVFDNEEKAQARAEEAVKMLRGLGVQAVKFDLFEGFEFPAGYDLADCIQTLSNEGKLA